MGSERHYTIIDVETTGGDPRRDRLTEIAIYRYDGTEVIDSFTSLVNPGQPIPEFITRITGIDNDMVRDAPPFYEIARRVVEITEGAVFVAHNVRFDYSFIQKEYRQLGYTFSRKQLCTMKLSRKLLPGLPSYSLKNLCLHLGIPNEARHRAWGDATATVKLFEQLLHQSESKYAQRDMLRVEMAGIRLPPHLPTERLEDLPDQAGVYYFHNGNGDVLYVGKSKNIRQRVLSHFSGAHKAARTMKMIDQIHDVSHEFTGSELIALLRENEEIKRLQPPYNRAQRRRHFKFGVYLQENDTGYLTFVIDTYDETQQPLAGYPGRAQAESALTRRGREYQLCPKLYGVERGSGRCFHRQLHICQGACTGEEGPETYNPRVRQAAAALTYGRSDLDRFLIVGRGRHPEERSVVWVEDGHYRGYAYLDADLVDARPGELPDLIPAKPEAPDVQRILRGYLHKNPKEIWRI
ncbi:MAG: DNA polymerase III subunit epsilon [Bacteroidetes bacterium]|nr:MAG: DNA polymerase III subunit epsilon [Bacteroidota bacterium]